jgi:hypothetical protein
MARPTAYPPGVSVEEVDLNVPYTAGGPEHRVADVVHAFCSLPCTGNDLAAWDGGQVKGRRYTSSILNSLGLNNHFQGVQRLRGGPFLILSGGDPHGEGGSHLFIAKLSSRGMEPGGWHSNLAKGRKPSRDDRIVGRIDIDKELWHAGGMGQFGDVLAVPIENADQRRSQVVFYDFANPMVPRELPHRITRPNHKCGAVALTRLLNGRLLCAAWSDSESRPPEQRLDLYLSESTDLKDGFVGRPASIVWGVRRWAKFQTIAFVRQQGDKQLYLLGFETETFFGVTAPIPLLLQLKNISPTLPGRHYGRLIRLTGDESNWNDVDALASMRLEYITERRFSCRKDQCNMDAGTGVFVTDAGELLVYSVYHWRVGWPGWSLIRASEFTPRCLNGDDTAPVREGQP